jgi:glycosyltransferase involved in cell wall biosynthesis
MNEIGILSFKKIVIYLRIIIQTLKALIVFRPQLCYIALTAKGIAFYRDFLIIFLFKLFRRKVVLHFHNKGVCLSQDKWLDDKLYRFVFKDSKIILLSDKLYTDIRKYVDRKNVFVCPNGIPKRIINNNKQKIKHSNSTVQLLFLSNMMKAKGVFDLLEACRILNKKGLNFECNFVGKWTNISEKEFENAVEEKEIAGKVFAHGPKYGKEKEIFFEKADIFVFPTFYNNECFPLVLLEALQHALPVISTDEGGIPDIVENGITGYIVAKRKPDELARHIEELILNPALREKMGEAGRQKFQEQYTLEHFEKRMCEILLCDYI